ncbi:MAG: MerR family transcriptional regulator [Clostridium sp.]|uniref:MerR family transcriptional regulator n=1 Tax=Clostridium sp. TaxID=1506 RepID=UPI002FCB7459
MDIRFTIGEIARLHNLSKQTLIFYDKEGIFSPSIVDENNGYRYYTADQLEVLDSILILKEIGLSLKEIKEFLKTRDVSVSLELMKGQLSSIQQQIRELKRTEKRLGRKISTLEEYSNSPTKGVVFKNISREYLFVDRVQGDGSLLELDICLKKLITRAKKEDIPYFYQIGAIIPQKNIRSGRYTTSAYGFLPLSEKIKSSSCIEKEAGLYASVYHRGTYESIGISYNKLIQEVESRGYSLNGDSYEYCIFDSLTSRKREDYTTEIQIRIQE